ncbi:hypothetical protein DF021_27940 [Burkholderia stagnalis]|uniref:Uncharacterized protein n=1 Tax=Burkholderia stagnalis TaxID=1503054 RepID=A0ABX9YHG4_9BURK|nr:hypothetical protein DF158_29015 [Burkholderia stagnalis]RQQ61620.1 hypothetical protein DF137_29705 [Burkholderia stagnalis]RQQ62652.1 hypothetical protein DF139_28915 [Burkholderia stagnalis]RQQ76530.1 hypothetical protein DF138_28830 [Burkholderia stagnalis]RQQ82305.1 hypothetical protein DF134_30080 [Burkholderia stagnalis]
MPTPYAPFDRRGQWVNTGDAPCNAWPNAAQTVLDRCTAQDAHGRLTRGLPSRRPAAQFT